MKFVIKMQSGGIDVINSHFQTREWIRLIRTHHTYNLLGYLLIFDLIVVASITNHYKYFVINVIASCNNSGITLVINVISVVITFRNHGVT